MISSIKLNSALFLSNCPFLLCLPLSLLLKTLSPLPWPCKEHNSWVKPAGTGAQEASIQWQPGCLLVTLGNARTWKGLRQDGVRVSSANAKGTRAWGLKNRLRLIKLQRPRQAKQQEHMFIWRDVLNCYRKEGRSNLKRWTSLCWKDLLLQTLLSAPGCSKFRWHSWDVFKSRISLLNLGRLGCI